MFELRACPTCRHWPRERNDEKCPTCGDIDHPGFVVVVSSGYWPLVSMSPQHYGNLARAALGETAP